MTITDAKRIMEAARKHNEAVVDLSVEIMEMMNETALEALMNAQKSIRSLESELENLRKDYQRVVEFAAENDKSIELEKLNQAYHDLVKENEELKRKLTPVQKGKKRGRPKKNEPETVHELAQEIFG